jgi:hypothetical protein
MVKMAETQLADPAHYEQRYSVWIGDVLFGRFVRRPVAMLPEERTMCFLDNGPRHGVIPRKGVAVFREGRWAGAKFEPTHWTQLETDEQG